MYFLRVKDHSVVVPFLFSTLLTLLQIPGVISQTKEKEGQAPKPVKKEPEGKPLELDDQFTTLAHQVSSGEVTLMDERTIHIDHFVYDGTGPSPYFMVGKDTDSYTEEFTELTGTIIPMEDGRLRQYSLETVTLTLPDKLTWKDVDYLAVFCVEFNHNFGYIRIPDDLNLPKYKGEPVEECEDPDPSSFSSASSGGGGRPAGGPRPPPPSGGGQEPQGIIGSLLGALG